MRAAFADADAPTMPGMFLDQGAYRGASAKSSLSAEEAALAFDTVLRCGLLLHSRGAATVDVESAVHSSAVALGLKDVEVDIIYNSITLSATVEGRPTAAVRVVRLQSPDYSRLTDGHRLISDIVEGGIDAVDARARLDAIERRPRRHSRNLNTLAAGGLSAAVALSLGSGWAAAGIALLTSAAIQRLGRWLYGTGLPPLFTYAVGGFIAVMVAAATTQIEIPVRPSLLVAAGIVAMLPGSLLVAAVRDALNGYPLTAGARLLEVAVVIGGIVVGVVAGLGVSSGLFGTDFGLLPPSTAGNLTLALRATSAAVAAAMVATIAYARRRTLLWASGTGCVGFLVSYVAGQFTNELVEIGLAAVVIGLVAAIVARRMDTLSLVLVVPAVVPLLPGLTIYRAALLLADGDAINGVLTMLEAITHAAALASGVLVGEFLVDAIGGKRREQLDDRAAR